METHITSLVRACYLCWQCCATQRWRCCLFFNPTRHTHIHMHPHWYQYTYRIFGEFWSDYLFVYRVSCMFFDATGQNSISLNLLWRLTLFVTFLGLLKYALNIYKIYIHVWAVTLNRNLQQYRLAMHYYRQNMNMLSILT